MNTGKTTYLAAILTCSMLLAGSLSAPNAQAQQSHTIRLAGHKSVPPVGTSAGGKLTVTFHQDTLTVKGAFEDLLGQYHSAGIFVAPEGERGNRLYLLTVELNEEKTGGKFPADKNKFHLNDPQKMWLTEGEFYISIVSYEHTNGEIRAQIPAMGDSAP